MNARDDLPMPARFWVNVEPGVSDDECWLWTGLLDRDGYGRFAFWVDGVGRAPSAHRFAYELEVGPIPDGMTLDHVRARGCTHRHCVNPRHLEPVTLHVNQLRGAGGVRTHCPRGHPYDEANTYNSPSSGRTCRACKRERDRVRVRVRS